MARKRTCTHCGDTHPLTADYFQRSTSNRTGFESTCKGCRNGQTDKPQLHQRHVRRRRLEARPPRQDICGICGSLPWRVEGDACVACGLKHGEEKAIGLAYCQAFHENRTVFPDMSEVA